MATKYSIVEVAVLQRLPRTVHVFDYTLTETTNTCAVGDLVTVSFRGRKTMAVVVRRKQRTNVRARLQPVAALEARQFVSAKQLQLARHMANHYGVSLSAALRLALPVLPNSRFKPEPLPLAPALKRTRLLPLNLIFNTQAERLETVLTLAQRLKDRKQQLLILVPELVYLHRWQDYLQKNNLSCVPFSAEGTTLQQRAAWLGARAGTSDVVIATRACLFLPFTNLGGIVIDYAESELYKQSDQNPRYDGIEVARWLAELHQVSLVQLSPAPRVEHWYQAQRREAAWRRLRDEPRAQLTIADLGVAHRLGYKNGLSPELTQALELAASKDKRTFIYLNRRGSATSVLCQDCGFTPACKKCQRPYAWDAQRNVLACFHCGTVEKMPLPCPRCGSVNLKYQGTGLTKLAQEIQKLFPQAKTVTIEGEQSKVSATELAKARIIIGSRAAWKHIDLSQFELIGVVLPDIELSIPEYKANEELFQTMRFFITSGARHVVVQTYRPEHFVWQNLLRTWENFYPEEIKLRTDFHYPPLTQMVRFTCEDKDERVALAQARNARSLIEKKLTAAVELTGPYPDYYHQVRGRFRFHILLRYHSRAFNPETLWSVLPDTILIDRHPWNILN